MSAPGRPRCTPAEVPQRGDFPAAALATPRLVDFTGDGLIDIVASTGERIYFFRNVGQRNSPEFQAHLDCMPGVGAMPRSPDRNSSTTTVMGI